MTRLNNVDQILKAEVNQFRQPWVSLKKNDLKWPQMEDSLII